jgi:hypothetical protein
VTGIAALLNSYNQNLLSDDFGEVLKRTARDIYEPGRDDTTGYGLVRADDALVFVRPPRKVQQAQLTPTGSAAYASPIAYSGVPMLPDGTYNTIRWDLTATYNFPVPYESTPDAWFRTSGTIGARLTTSNIDYRHDPPAYAEIIVLSATSITLKTYVYQLFGAPIQWYPDEPSHSRIALTAIGPVSIVAVEDTPAASHEAFVSLLNPGFGEINFLLTLTKERSVGLQIYDTGGRLVRTVRKRQLAGGNHDINWDGLTNAGSPARSGVYFFRLTVDGVPHRTEKAILLR